MAPQTQNQLTSGGSELDVLASLLKMFQGEKTSSTKTDTGGSFTETQQTQMSPEIMAGLLKSALESNQGLASVSQGQRSAGLYNSSTNRLLANDLLSRLTARTAEAGAPKVVSRQAAPTISTTNKTDGGSDMLGKLLLGMTAYQKLGGTKGLKSGYKDILDLISGGSASGASATSNFPGVDTAMAMDAGAVTPTGLDVYAAEPGLQAGAGISYIPSALSMMEVPSVTYGSEAADTGTVTTPVSAPAVDTYALSEPTFTAEQVGAAPPASDFYVPTEEEFANFTMAPSATGTASNTTASTGGASAASAASAISNVPQVSLSGAGSSVYNLYSGITALTDSSSKNDIGGAISTAAGAKGAYDSYQAYQAYQAAQAAKAASDAAAAAQAAQAASAASDTASAASAASAASSTSNTSSAFTASSGGGNALGYVGPVLDAFYAPNNPQGEQGKDYRKAVGGAILNYFGFGWATPIVDAIARPVLDYVQDNSAEVAGVAGATAADPIGALISGEYNPETVLKSGLDPANIMGWNEGGSVGGTAGMLTDPIGIALFGEDSLGGQVAQGVNDVKESIDDFAEQAWDDLGCFLTTACMKSYAEHFDDDCYELTQLRRLRDLYVSELPEGQEVIDRYYRIAPQIVTSIDKMVDSSIIWKQIYRNYILPAASLAEKDLMEASYEKYTALIDYVSALTDIA